MSLFSRAFPSAGRLLTAALLLAGAAPLAGAAAGAVSWNNILRQPAAWYGTADARRIADSVVQYQTTSGGWPKNTDMTRPPAGADVNPTAPGTIDNSATTTQLEFLAKIITAAEKPADGERYRQSFDKGFGYLLEAQYPNGGWPQYFPLRNGYWSHITFNDNATVRVLNLLTAAAAGQAPYAFLAAPRRDQARAAVAKGIDCILKCQIKTDGKLTVWCAQHDEKSLAPAKARAYELPSYSGSESVGLVRYLMGIEKPSPEVIAAVRGAVAWFEAAKLTGIRTERRNGDVLVVKDAGAPPLWARFYDLETGKPYFCGRDGIKKDQLADIEQERRAGYAWYGNWPATLLETEFPVWEKRLPAAPPAKPAAPPADKSP